ncbi:unnamed protein product [Caenorhabditis angaria]|uniref:Uncharacterized protein n=1 Tax=Caenorhabditis angaria TaxID=860376 RepID=A0A9P1IHI5_9PELO|nr:unnamed protein product [Caenorhabditis angaria]
MPVQYKIEKKETTKILVKKTEIRKIVSVVNNAAPKQISAPKPKPTQSSIAKPKAAAPKPIPKQNSAPRSTQKAAPTQANLFLMAINPKISNCSHKTAQISNSKQKAPAARPTKTVARK